MSTNENIGRAKAQVRKVVREACERFAALSLRPDEIEVIAIRVAEHLPAPVPLSAQDRETLAFIRRLAEAGTDLVHTAAKQDPDSAKHSRDCVAAMGLIDRLLSASR